MLNKNKFHKNIMMVIMNFSMNVNDGYVSIVYNFLNASSISDDSFEKACNDMIKFTANDFFSKFNGKMPTMADWMVMCEVKNRKQIESITCESFINKISSYVNTKFVWDEMYIEFVSSISEFEKTLLNRHGGIKELWTSVNRDDGYKKDISKILKQLREDYLNGISDSSETVLIENAESITKITSSLFKVKKELL